MAESIEKKIDRVYSLINDYKEGAKDTRYKSWEWCHQAFLSHKGNNTHTDEDYDFLSLHLAFYLASWGMYRGSSFLLQRDYKAHKKAVKMILDPEYDLLWDYQPKNENIDDAHNLLFDPNDGIYWKIKKSYGEFSGNDDCDDLASDTLITKILLGTFGCIPAFDRFLKVGIKNYSADKSGNKSIGGYKLTQSIEKTDGKSATDTFKALAAFALQNDKALRVNSGFYYPPMKCVDMYFWEIGYEMDIADTLRSKKTSSATKDKLLKTAFDLGYCKSTDPDKAGEEIASLNF